MCNIGCGPVSGVLLGQWLCHVDDLHLELSNNCLETTGVRMFMDGLCTGSMKHLWLRLSSNAIGDAGLRALVQGTLSMQSLQTCHLILSYNRMTSSVIDRCVSKIVERTHIALFVLDVRGCHATDDSGPTPWDNSSSGIPVHRTFGRTIIVSDVTQRHSDTLKTLARFHPEWFEIVNGYQ